MASMAKRPNGHWWCFCKGATGKRHTVRLGKTTEKRAGLAKTMLAQLEGDFKLGERPDRKTTGWLDGLSDEVHARVAATGLVESRPGNDKKSRQELREGTSAASKFARGTLDYLLAEFPKSLSIKDSSGVNIDRVAENLKRYFGGDRPLTTISAGDADDFFVWLTDHGRKNSSSPLAKATVSRRYQEAGRIFGYAVRKEWVAKNPFSGKRYRVDTNRSREVYVTPALIDELIRIEPDGEMRLKLALARYMGLRHDSEFRTLAWADVDWETNYLKVRSPKTEHHEGGDLRYVPIAPKVLVQLQEQWDGAGEGATLLMPRLSSLSASASRSRLESLCRHVGVPLWKRVWNNLRASCENDWIREEGKTIFDVAPWMGHGPDVALKHYNRVAKDHANRETADLPPGYRPQFTSLFTSPSPQRIKSSKAK